MTAELDSELIEDGELFHYGVLRRSGRYPWGSGEDPEQNHRGFLGYVAELKTKGLSDPDIAKSFEISTTQLRAMKSVAKEAVREANRTQAVKLKTKGMSNVAIGQRMGIPESSVRALLDPSVSDKRDILREVSTLLESRTADGSFVDIGEGSENHLGISKTRLSSAVEVLKQKGYVVHNIQVDQVGTGQKTTIKVLAKPGTSYIDIVKNKGNIKPVAAFSEDGGRTMTEIKPPVAVDPKRLGVRYAEDGGTNADGVIYIRPGVDDISLGASKYAQVRIAVGSDGKATHYLKGMAMYKDDMPGGVDLQFNTNKSDTGDKLDALKGIKDDPTSPFGAVIRQKYYKDAEGKDKLSAINIVNEEGNWRDWSKSLSSQVLAKQGTALAKRQLDLALKSRQQEFEEINGLTNPVVKKALLEKFAEGADSASVHLKAAALPGQATHVILPIESMKESEIYAPKYADGTRVALVRFPHAGTFEIPELTVNNKQPEAKKSIGPGALDAVGIHPKVAERLSGADFDGDTVLVIPNNRGTVKSTPPLAGLKNFDPKSHYPPYSGMKTIDKGVWDSEKRKPIFGPSGPDSRAKQQKMGDVSNLITDMTLRGASTDELAAAVRHSMVVIDAEKHSLNYAQSYTDNNIASLKARYQGRGETGRLSGASTIVSRAGATVRVPNRKPRAASRGGPIDIKTGARVYEEVDAKRSTMIKSKKLAEVQDAHELSSGLPVEEIYADHSNSLKALANEARKATLSTGKVVYSSSAAQTYSKQLEELNSALNVALKNKPRERQAQLIANQIVAAKVADNPGMDNADLKKIKGQALLVARDRVGARKQQIYITDEQWAAIQAGALHTSKLESILNNADADRVRDLATPRAATVMTESKLELAKARIASGYTQSEVAESLGIPVSTLNTALHRGRSDGSG